MLKNIASIILVLLLGACASGGGSSSLAVQNTTPPPTTTASNPDKRIQFESFFDEYTQSTSCLLYTSDAADE